MRLRKPWISLSVGFFSLFMMSLQVGCASYRWGSADRSMPGGYRTVAISIFENKTPEVGIEVAFTRALTMEIERSDLARVTSPAEADLIIEGSLNDLRYLRGSLRTSANLRNLPEGAVLASDYRILLRSDIRVYRASDRRLLWSGSVNGESRYTAPQVAQAVVNTVNPLYNLSAQRQNIDLMAHSMMSEAFARLTENF